MMLLNGDCLEKLKELESNSVDSLVTDPPAGISFMGKDWDSDKGGRRGWVAWMADVMRECKRVLKPGAHGLVWAIPRTSHWTATALEDAGFEIRDVITHLFGQGFPKSLDISKAIDKAAGLQRPRVAGGQNGTNQVLGARKPGEAISGEAISGEAKQWSGWGTALKPASEHWVLVRKPCEEKTVAANVLKWGTGGINIDGCRIGSESIQTHSGRFPANLVLSHTPHCTDNQCDIECAIKALDEQSGNLSKSAGGASRFFYCAKISTSERGEGNNHPTVKSQKLMRYLCRLITPPGGTVLDPFMGSGSTGMAAKAEDFRFIGIELDPEYFQIASKRIEAIDIRYRAI